MVKKEVHSEATSIKRIHSKEEVEQMMLDNFVSLQKTLIDLAEKLDSLTNQTSKLLRLFELSAKSFIEKSGGGRVSIEDKETLDKIDKLLEQNKTIARSLVMMEEKIRGKPEIGGSFGPENIRSSQVSQDNSLGAMQPSISDSGLKSRQLPRF
ncbi:MAG: hypothetical protein WC796_03465 [Candidatus Pacearchaeota archaeon]|jgi:hypothetical protein